MSRRNNKASAYLAVVATPSPRHIFVAMCPAKWLWTRKGRQQRRMLFMLAEEVRLKKQRNRRRMALEFKDDVRALLAQLKVEMDRGRRKIFFVHCLIVSCSPAGHTIQEATEDGESLLSLACSAGYYELAEVLLRMRASVEDRGAKGKLKFNKEFFFLTRLCVLCR